jgi:hypothetical protein
MNRTEAVAQVQEVLGFRSDLTDRIVTQIGIANTRLRLAATKPWWTIEYVSLPIAAEAASVALPDDFIEEWEEGDVIYRAENIDALDSGELLLKNDIDTLFQLYGLTPGTPAGYGLTGDRLSVYPFPAVAGTIGLWYYRKDDDLLSGSSTNGYLTHIPEMIIGLAGLRIAQSIRDKEAIATFREMISEARTELYRQNESRKHSNADYQMGGAH